MMPPLALMLPGEAQRLIADRVKETRVAQGLKQQTLAERSGVTLASLRRFETTGDISLKHLVRVLHALGALDQLQHFLPTPTGPTSMDELLAQQSRRRPQRGHQ